MRPARGPQKIGDVLANVMARRGYAREQSAGELEKAWIAVAGQLLAARSCPTRIRRGVLEVVAGDSATLQELTFQKARLVQDLIEHLPQEKIQDLRFRVGNVI